MCIRDSSRSPSAWPSSRVSMGNWWNSSTTNSPCLLYTSDAADDLTRVDLGGRRFFQAEDGIRDLVRSRGLGDVYKRQFPLPVRLAFFQGFDGELVELFDNQLT